MRQEPGVQARESAGIGIPVDVFLHIPKTAGDTLNTILWRQYREVGYLEVPDPLPPSRYSAAEDTPFERVKRQVADPNWKRVGLIYGHMPFGIHEVLSGPVRYFTMVRDPIERAISHYYYVRRAHGHPLHREVVDGRMSLHDYVTTGITGELANGQTALVAGLEKDAPAGELAVLHRAQANIDSAFAVVGLTEQFDRSIVLFGLAMDWTKPLVYKSMNVTANRPPISAVPRKTIEAIEAQNELDQALYLFVRERFEAQIAEAASAKRGLRKLRYGNALYRHAPTLVLRGGWDLAQHLRSSARRIGRPADGRR